MSDDELQTGASDAPAWSRFRASAQIDAELGRSVEVMTLGESFDDAGSLACFSRAAVALCALSHPGVPTLLAASIAPPQLVCGQLAGATLSEVCQGLAAADRVTAGQFTLERLLADISRLCALLEDAHREGFVHRALRAESVVLGGFGDVYLKDWWYAQIPERYFEDARPGSQLEYMRGLPAFGAFLSDRAHESRPAWFDPARLPPELKAGWQVAPTADVWCVGQLLVEVLEAWRAAVEALSPSGLKADFALYQGALALAARACRPLSSERVQTARILSERIDSLLGEHRIEQQDRRRARIHRATGQLSLAAAALNPGDAITATQTAVANLSRALALDPHDAAALRLMKRLFARADDVLAGPVGEAYEQRRIAEQATGSRSASIALLFAVASQVGLLLLFPDPLWREVLAISALASTASAWIFLTSRIKRPRFWHRAVNLLLLLSTTGLLSLQFGPLIYAPAFSLACTVVAIVNLRPKRLLLVWALALMLATVVIPSVLMRLGAFPVSYLDSGQALFQRSGQTLAEAPTLTILAMGAVLMIVVPLALLGRTVDRLNRAERSLYTQAWLLRELLPDDPPESSVGAPAGKTARAPQQSSESNRLRGPARERSGAATTSDEEAKGAKQG